MTILKQNRTAVIAIAVLATLIALPIVWWLASPLFIDNTVDEAFPFDVPTAAEVAEMSPDEAQEAMSEVMDDVMEVMAEGELSAETEAALQEQVETASAAMPDKEMIEEMPEAADEWIVAATGAFAGKGGIYEGSGNATVFTQGDQRVLRFEDFQVTNGPDLHVLLVENLDGASQDEFGAYVDLGKLKGNVGDQNYEISADIDLSQYAGVIIYCEPFHVVFATASFGG